MIDRLKTSIAPRLSAIASALRTAFAWPLDTIRSASSAARRVQPDGSASIEQAGRLRMAIVLTAGAGLAAWLVWSNPPVQPVARGEVGIRVNRLTGSAAEFRDGSVLVVPGLHELRRYSLRDQVYRPAQSASATGAAPFQSIEGLSLGVDLTIRYALDGTKVATLSRNLPEDIAGEIVQPAVQGAIYRIFARFTVREIFSTRRAEIQQAIEDELKPKLAADGIVLRAVLVGKVDLPPDYRAGMERLLAEELASEKMRYTLDLKEKRVQETALDAEADKVRRETAAKAAAGEQIIAARAQEEAMRHVLPFKQKQIEQRQLEAEAEGKARVRTAEGNAQARRIEASGEAESRQKLADAEAYRLERLGKIASAQMARDGALITRHPLLIQKALADKLSDKISVIIAPPGTDGAFLGANLIGGQPRGAGPAQERTGEEASEGGETEPMQGMQRERDANLAAVKGGR